MGISLKEIENRKYDGNVPVRFEYTVKGLDGPHGETQEMRIWFESVNPLAYGLLVGKPAYKVFTIIDSVVYEKIFQMPKSEMSLEMVVATGLNLLRVTFQEEAAYKEMVNYTIAEIIKDM